jgi:hypothetical protein
MEVGEKKAADAIDRFEDRLAHGSAMVINIYRP